MLRSIECILGFNSFEKSNALQLGGHEYAQQDINASKNRMQCVSIGTIGVTASKYRVRPFPLVWYEVERVALHRAVLAISGGGV